MTRNIHTRREFGVLVGAGALGAVGALSSAASAAIFMAQSKLSPSQSAAAAVLELLSAGEIGAVTLAHSSIGGCGSDVVEKHREQLLFLTEALEVPTIGSHYTTKVSPASCGYAGMMTSVSLASGARIEVVTSSLAVAGAGCVIRGKNGHIIVKGEHISLFSDKGVAMRIVTLDRRHTNISAHADALRLTQEIMGDALSHTKRDA